MKLKWPLLAVVCSVAFAAPRSSIEQVLSFSFPVDLIAAPKDGKVAWVLDERGARNVWVAEVPSYKGRRLTNFTADDGQEIDQMDWLPDAKGLVYVRGGDFETNGDNPNPASFPDAVEQAIWLVSLNGDAPRKLADGNSPAVSPKGDRIAFLKADQVWSIGIAKDDKPAELIHAKGHASELRWSPDGSRLSFVNSRGDHSFIGLYDYGSKSLKYLDPSVDRDLGPVWSPDGKEVAFVRVPASTRAFMFGPVRSAQDPWSIRVASAETGTGRELWKAQPGAGSAFHPVVAENQIFWGAGDRIVFPWEKTGWVHLYSISTRGDTPTEISGSGDYEVEHVAMTWDRKSVLFASNAGDIDRRHITKVSVLGEGATAVTKGTGIEWSPVELSEGHGFAMLRSDWKTPAHASALLSAGSAPVDLAPQTLPAEFPASSLVQPQQVMLTAADGLAAPMASSFCRRILSRANTVPR